jgi:hypothetical protein
VEYSPQRLFNAGFHVPAYPIVCASFVGGCALPAIIAAPLLWSRKAILTTVVLTGTTMAIAVHVLRSHLQVVPLGTSIEHHWASIQLELTIFIAGGVSVLALAAAEYWQRRDAESMFLAFWVFGTFFFAAFLNWTINARSLLPLIPAVGILIARRLERHPIPGGASTSQVALALLLSGGLSFWITLADADVANSVRRASRVLYQETRTAEGSVWFAGGSNLQYYMERMGVRPLDLDRTILRPGDVLLVPFDDFGKLILPPRFISSTENIYIPLSQPVTTWSSAMGAGFYWSSRGPLPFAFGIVPPQRYTIYTIGAVMRPEQWPNPSAN